MRLTLAVLVFMAINMNAFGAIGKIAKITQKGEAHLIRNEEKVLLTNGMPLELNDKILSSNSVISIELNSKTLINVNQDSVIALAKSEKKSPVINFLSGVIKVKVPKQKSKDSDQKVQAEGVAFTAKNSEFEVSETTESIDLDVSQGEVVVSSPYVQTFVPEIVKAKEGFSFGKMKKGFSRRPFQSKFVSKK